MDVSSQNMVVGFIISVLLNFLIFELLGNKLFDRFIEKILKICFNFESLHSQNYFFGPNLNHFHKSDFYSICLIYYYCFPDYFWQVIHEHSKNHFFNSEHIMIIQNFQLQVWKAENLYLMFLYYQYDEKFDS